MRPFVIIFPQYYPTPTNDKAWGFGFTDWHLVAKANAFDEWPRRAPKKGFYDGSDLSIQAQQIEEIKSYRLGGIALYHYWFFKHQELDSFEKNIIQGKLPPIKWFLIWASESWTRRWIGKNEVILELNDKPSDEDIKAHCEYLVRCFENKNYLHINQRPLFVIYNISHFRYPKYLVEKYRNTFLKLNINPVLGACIKNPGDIIYADLFDVNYLFEPRLFFGFKRFKRLKFAKFLEKISKVLKPNMNLYNLFIKLYDYIAQKGKIYEPKEFIKYFYSSERKNFANKLGNYQNVICPGWNNTPRYGKRKFTALLPLSPHDFRELLLYSSKLNNTYPVLINAWNEWSEGAAIEPCYYEKTKYLDAIVDIYIE